MVHMRSGQKVSSRGHSNIKRRGVQQKAVYKAIKWITMLKYLNSTKKGHNSQNTFLLKEQGMRDEENTHFWFSQINTRNPSLTKSFVKLICKNNLSYWENREHLSTPIKWRKSFNDRENTRGNALFFWNAILVDWLGDKFWRRNTFKINLITSTLLYFCYSSEILNKA